MHDHLDAPRPQLLDRLGQGPGGVVVLGRQLDEAEPGVAVDRQRQLRPPPDPQAERAEPGRRHRGRKYGSRGSPWIATSTGMPTVTPAGATSTSRVIIRTPSARSTSATTYGTSSR